MTKSFAFERNVLVGRWFGTLKTSIKTFSNIALALERKVRNFPSKILIFYKYSEWKLFNLQLMVKFRRTLHCILYLFDLI